MNTIQPYNDTFIVTFPSAAALFQSDQVQSPSSTYVENGTQLSYTFTTAMLPDTDQMAEVAVVETTIYMTLVSGSPVSVVAQDQAANVLDTVTLAASGTATIWGAFLWGFAPWGGTGGANSGLYPQQLPWHYPIVFRRMQLSATGNSTSQTRVGRTHLRYQVLNFLQQ
jgi:hypothetical protein